jgi:DNA-binding beta-propeller fold protein YncE
VPQFKGQRLHWYVVDAHSGKLIKTLETPQSKGAHNTIYALDGSRVFLEGVSSTLVSVAETATHTVVQTVGPFGDRVRPFTLSGNTRLLYANVDNLLGFEVADVQTGRLLHRVEVTGFSNRFERSIPHGCPSHGIALSPDEKELWVSDGINGYLHLFDNTVMPPRQVKSIKTRTPPYWITFSQDGKHVFPSSGDVIDATSKQIVGALTDEKGRPVDSEKIVEITFAAGKPVSVGNQFGVGHLR